MKNEPLFKSIESWKQKRERVLRGKIPSISDCPCCEAYGSCAGCPIKEYTGQRNCYDTPYSEVSNLIIDGSVDFEKLLLAVDKEIEFLEKVYNVC